MSDIDETLNERGKRYGLFVDYAEISQNIKSAMYKAAKYQDLTRDKKEALEMIAHKIARILNGDSNYHDNWHNWHDIIGYATIVADTIIQENPELIGDI